MLDILILGCGSRKDQQVVINGREHWRGHRLVRVDIEPSHHPDVVWDLNRVPWPFDDNSFDEIHAYEILEHLGRQGDARAFFECFYQVWRVLRPNGVIAATVPRWDSVWAWGDPSHSRVINEGSLTFLDQTEYTKQVGNTPMSDFRSVWHGDLDIVTMGKDPGTLWFVLRAVKPPRTRPDGAPGRLP